VNLATATPWLVALAGLFVCFRGYRAFKFGLVLTAFLIGAHVALLRVDLLPPDPEWLRPVGVVVAGLLAAVLWGWPGARRDAARHGSHALV
jgi:peptidoglycan/LPS O-acetylase OafA/YrhL